MDADRINKTIINLVRIFFGALLIFELLNFAGALKFKLVFTWFGLVFTLAFSLFLLELITYYFKKRKGIYPPATIWVIAFFGISFDAFGDMFFLYAKYPNWDRFSHFFMSMGVCYISYIFFSELWFDSLVLKMLKKRSRIELPVAAAVFFTLALSALYEIEEYLEDLVFGSNRLGPGVDTADDLVFNLLGILAAVAIIYLSSIIKHGKNRPLT